MSNAVDAVKDFNPKVALEALNCVEILIRHHKHDFLPLANMTFDVLLAELCDFKVCLHIDKSCKHMSTCSFVLLFPLYLTS